MIQYIKSNKGKSIGVFMPIAESGALEKEDSLDGSIEDWNSLIEEVGMENDQKNQSHTFDDNEKEEGV